jgi:hypothetical protein
MDIMLRFEFTEQMAQQIAEIIQGAPYRVAAPILQEMQKQINAQQAPPPSGNGKEVAEPVHQG